VAEGSGQTVTISGRAGGGIGQASRGDDEPAACPVAARRPIRVCAALRPDLEPAIREPGGGADRGSADGFDAPMVGLGPQRFEQPPRPAANIEDSPARTVRLSLGLDGQFFQELGQAEGGQHLSQESSAAPVRLEGIECGRGGVGQVGSPAAGQEEFSAGPGVLFEEDDGAPASGGRDGRCKPRRPGPNDDAGTFLHLSACSQSVRIPLRIPAANRSWSILHLCQRAVKPLSSLADR